MVPSCKWERLKGQLGPRAAPKGVTDSDDDGWGNWTPDAKLPLEAEGTKSGKGKGKGKSSKGTCLDKGKGKGGKGNDKKARKHQDFIDSKALVSILRHCQGRRGEKVVASMGSQGEVEIAVLSSALHLPESRLRALAQTSTHPSGDPRYELIVWMGVSYIRATGKHSLEIAGTT